jgi:NAD+ diphosphatase
MKYCPQCAVELEPKVIEGQQRMVCASSSCDFVFWNNPVPVVAIVAETAEGVVVAHNRNWPQGIFSIISGFLECNESPREGAIRELKEELGLDPEEVTFLGNFSFYKMNQLMIVFHIKTSGEVKLNDELDAVKIVPKEKLIGWQRNQKFEIGEWLEKFKVVQD